MTVVVPEPESPPEGGSRPGPGATRPFLSSGPLSVWTDQSANRCVLRLRGTLGADTVSLLDRHVDLLGCLSCAEVVVDLAGLDGLDPVGARLLSGLTHYVAGLGGRLTVRGGTTHMKALLADAERHLSA